MKSAINTKVLSGFVELLPEQQVVFDFFKGEVENSFKNHGFFDIETPILERSEILLSKSGGETEKQIYRLNKGENDLALRFDLTVPLARYVAEHEGCLIFPFRRYSIGKVWRGERAQKGRFREFYQADIDIVDENELSIVYDMEIMETLAYTVGGLANIIGFKQGIEVRYSNRKIWDSFFDKFGIDADTSAAIMNLIDKKRKMSADKFNEELERIASSREIYADICKVLSGDLAGLGLDTKEFDDLKAKFNDLPTISFVPDMSIVRGLDYYTGTVFETFIKGYEEIGSVASGGRYANLCSNFSKKNFIGVGGSIGLSRFLVPLIEEGRILPSHLKLRPLLIIIPLDEKFYALASTWSGLIGERVGKSTIYSIFKNRKLKHHLEYAGKVGARFVGLLGEDEFKSQSLTIKNMDTGEQQELAIAQVSEFLNQKLKP